MAKDSKEYYKEYYKTHKDAIRASQKEYYKNNKDAIRASQKEYYKDNKDDILASQKQYYKDNKDDIRASQKQYNKENKDAIRAYMQADTNLAGVTKNSIRNRSRYFLFTKLEHPKLEGYEIHHAFGYEDPERFIYMPKELHLKIHQYLRDNNIDADSNHFAQIAHLIYACERYVYIKV